MGRRKNKQAQVAHVSSKSRMDPDQSECTLKPALSEDEQDLATGEKSTNEWFNVRPKMSDVLATPLPDTPIKPSSKKSKREGMDSDNTSAAILAAIQDLAGKYDKMFEKIASIDQTTAVTAKQIENLSSTVHQLVAEVSTHKEALQVVNTEILELKQVNATLKEEVGVCKRYSWRWTLKLHGVQEKPGEDVRSVVINILSKVVPGISDRMDDAVDIAHRLGPQRKDGSWRSIIILFALRRFRDIVWQSARGCTFLRDNKLRFTEALCPDDRVAREKLWPLIKKAREDGKKASFRGSFALIDGKRYDYADVK